ncbi:hypothetical protein [Streptomyces sp. NPDC046985]|uniref:hypothetical protein n=1 Tax=Streptomyces sp. NPDC046985 TaxID=3155377 RepID=UPI003403404B
MSTKTVAEKLRITAGARLWIWDPAHLSLVTGLPQDVDTDAGPGEADVTLAFVEDAAALHRCLSEHGDALRQAPVNWIAYPKGNRADINRDTLARIAGDYGLRPNAQVAVDERWSALRLRALRPGEAPVEPGAAR